MKILLTVLVTTTLLVGCYKLTKEYTFINSAQEKFTIRYKADIKNDRIIFLRKVNSERLDKQGIEKDYYDTCIIFDATNWNCTSSIGLTSIEMKDGEITEFLLGETRKYKSEFTLISDF